VRLEFEEACEAGWTRRSSCGSGEEVHESAAVWDSGGTRHGGLRCYLAFSWDGLSCWSARRVWAAAVGLTSESHDSIHQL